MYNIFEGHFDPLRLSKIGMAHPVFRVGNFHLEVQVPWYYCLEPRVTSTQGLEVCFQLFYSHSVPIDIDQVVGRIRSEEDNVKHWKLIRKVRLPSS